MAGFIFSLFLVLELISILLVGQDMDQDPLNNPPGHWSANQGQQAAFAENAAASLGGVSQVRATLVCE